MLNIATIISLIKLYVAKMSGQNPMQVQADLGQNDETAPDYVKGRTHWYEPGGEEVLSPIVISAADVEPGGPGFGTFALPGVTFPNPDVGEVYTVVFNGVAYTAKVVSTYGPPRGIGNKSLFTGTAADDTGEPFFICFGTDGSYVELWPAWPVSDDITIAVYRGDKTPKYVPLDERFIPDSIARKTDIPTSSGNSGGAACLMVNWANTGTSSSPVYSVDKTFAEIKAAYDSGMLVFLCVEESRFLIQSCSADRADFYEFGISTINQYSVYCNERCFMRSAK